VIHSVVDFFLWRLLLLSLVEVLACGLRLSWLPQYIVVCGVPRFSRSVGSCCWRDLLVPKPLGESTPVVRVAAGRTGLSFHCDSDLHWASIGRSVHVVVPVVPDLWFVVGRSIGMALLMLVEMKIAAVAFHSCGLQCHNSLSSLLTLVVVEAS
jgi:hypothetical protein